MMINKISDQTIKLLNKLTTEQKAKVDQVVRTHVRACLRNGSPLESFDRLLIEAVEVVKLEERVPETRYDFVPGVEPFRHYEQYTSPREL
ncbi:MAG: hypothetical protein ACOYLN_02840 [Blastocatellia bacterium]|jgi:hypothetical protein